MLQAIHDYLDTAIMTIRHHKGELLRTDGDALEYRYFPDHVEAPQLSGVFRVSPRDWVWQIVSPARADGRDAGSAEAQCIGALVHKLKKAFVPGSPAPQELFFIA